VTTFKAVPDPTLVDPTLQLTFSEDSPCNLMWTDGSVSALWVPEM